MRSFLRASHPSLDLHALERAYQEPAGRLLEMAERRLLATVLAGLFGYHLLQVGAPANQGWLSASPIHAQMVVVPKGTDAGHRPQVEATPDGLPFESESIDVLLLPHTLEFVPNPHDVLREAYRVLIPEGHLVVLGLNPWGAWAPWRLAMARRNTSLWASCPTFSALRVGEWLRVLGMQQTGVERFLFRPPVAAPRVLHRLRRIETFGERWVPWLGAGYVLTGRKRVAGMIPLRPHWRDRRRWAVRRAVRPLIPGN